MSRTDHPFCSFAALGPKAKHLTQNVPLQSEFHLAEHRADFTKSTNAEGCAMMVDGKQAWVEFEMLALETDDFIDMGHAFRKTGGETQIMIGEATLRVMNQRSLVDFAVQYMTENRN